MNVATPPADASAGSPQEQDLLAELRSSVLLFLFAVLVTMGVSVGAQAVLEMFS